MDVDELPTIIPMWLTGPSRALPSFRPFPNTAAPQGSTR